MKLSQDGWQQIPEPAKAAQKNFKKVVDKAELMC